MGIVNKLTRKTKIWIAASAAATSIIALGVGITITYSKNKDYYYKKQSMEIFKSDKYFLSGQLKALINGEVNNSGTRIYIKSPTNVSILAWRLFEYKAQTIIGLKGDGLLSALNFWLEHNKTPQNTGGVKDHNDVGSRYFSVILQNSPKWNIDDFDQLKTWHEKWDLGIYESSFMDKPAIKLENSYADSSNNMSFGLNMDGLPDWLINQDKLKNEFDKLESISITGISSNLNTTAEHLSDDIGHLINFVNIEQLKFNFGDDVVLTWDRT